MEAQSLHRKSGKLSSEEEHAYKQISDSLAAQQQDFEQFVEKRGLESYAENIYKNFGLHLDNKGRLNYTDKFKPLNLPYDLCYVRHGKTEGNTEPRVFQGYVDYPENHLNHVGLEQAVTAADKMDVEMDKNQWIPDLIVFSPLTRAIQTGNAFSERHPDIKTCIVVNTHEMCFGEWDNIRVIDISPTSFAHLFYLNQNAIVQAEKPHIVQSTTTSSYLKKGSSVPSESFIDVLHRATKALQDLSTREELLAIKDRRARVLMYGHSMIGAAISILMGNGNLIEDGSALGFDGKYVMSHATPTFLPAKSPENVVQHSR